MINTRNLIFYDMETGSKNPDTTQPLELAAVAINPRKLEVIPNSMFHSYIKPWDEKTRKKKGIDEIQDEALAVNKITPEMWKDSPTEDIVWANFVAWTHQWNLKKSSWDAPIASHFNGINFDMKIVQRLCKMYGPWDNKKQQQKVFNPIIQIDLSHITFMLNENNPEVDGNSMAAIRKWLNLSDAAAHSATSDVEQGADILCRCLRLLRSWSAKTQFN